MIFQVHGNFLLRTEESTPVFNDGKTKTLATKASVFNWLSKSISRGIVFFFTALLFEMDKRWNPDGSMPLDFSNPPLST